MKVELLKYPNESDWDFCKLCTLETVGKEPKRPPSLEWKKKILEARHSPIRTLQFAFRFVDLPYWVSVHLCRHVHAQPFVRSQRNDRQDKYDRTKARQDSPVNMIWYMNAESLMIIANKRLCNQASAVTRYAVKKMCELVEKTCPEFKGLLVPMCVYHGGKCHEMFPCSQKHDKGVMLWTGKIKR